MNPFDKIPARCEEVVSVYADYKHFNEVFQDDDIPTYGNFLELLRLIPNGNRSELSVGKGPVAHNKDDISFWSKNQTKHETGENCVREDKEVEDGNNDCDYDGKDDDAMSALTSLFSADQLTLWLSSQGAHTPLHYDTYGCNLVVQLVGRKRWRLWPPCSQSSLPPPPNPSAHLPQFPSSSSATLLSSQNRSSLPRVQPCQAPHCLKLPCSRIPYEESSVYSTYDPRCIAPAYNVSPSHDLVIEEGDVLFIPKHYWHFVETDSELSLSVNLWLPVPLPYAEQLVVCRNDPRHRKGGREKDRGGKVDGKNDDGDSPVSEMDRDEVKIEIKKNVGNEQIKTNETTTISDTYSRLAEAATRMVFGALKGSVSRYFETDDIR